jgi:hypothetical protein
MMKTTGKQFAAVAAGLALAGFMSAAQSGKIISVPSASGAEGFGGWNLGNVTITVPGGSFDEGTGAYTIGPDGLYQGDVDDGAGTVMAIVLAKDYPVGEPPGIKIVNDDLLVKEPKPQDCILATSYLEDHYLDSGDPQQVICSSPFQSHKRFKVAMLPGMVDGEGSESVDLVFNVEPDAVARDYQVFQKINNWTGKRLEGFRIEVGFGVGAAFQTVSEAGVPLASLSVSVPGTIWDPEDLATFSHGLFGPADKHFPNDGFFDDVRAGFQIDEYPKEPGTKDTLTATTMLASNYADVPPGAGAVANQFGPWLPNIWLPQGIFFDDDADPETDDQLVAWYGYNPANARYEWMYGGNGVVGTAFGAVTAEVLAAWSADPLYNIGVIDDLVNIGLNYLVTIGDVTTFPASANNTFTIRITPTADTSGTGAPGYVGIVPPGSGTLVVTGSIQPGDDVVITVTDPDLNVDAGVIELVEVPVDNDVTADSVMVTLTETGPDTGVFTGVLTTFDRTDNAAAAANIGVAGGDSLTTTYEDKQDALGNPVTLSAETSVTGVVIDSDDGGGGGGGGGCHASTVAGPDFTLVLPVLLSLLYLGWRRSRRPEPVR